MIADPEIYALFLECHRLFRYEDGALIRRVTTSYRGISGDRADQDNPKGYRQVHAQRRMHWAHRIIFLMHRGYLPVEVDHRNGIRSDNRIENLRSANSSTNKQNLRIRKDNTSGIKGVCWHKGIGKWMAQCTVNKNYTILGYFDSAADAAKVVQEFRSIHHGEYANHG